MSNSSQREPRIPEEVGGVQVNFCKNPTCPNFGVPASTQKQPRGRNAQASELRDAYTKIGDRRNNRYLKCHHCQETPTIKSNQGIYEEFVRFWNFFKISKPLTCPNNECANHLISIRKKLYSSYGKTAAGNKRYKCNKCGKVFSEQNHKRKRANSYKTKSIFLSLMNKSPLNRICEIHELNPKSLYDYINYIHYKCLKFASKREYRFLTEDILDKVYISVDGQVFTTNWKNKYDKRNITLSAYASVDNVSRYVFANHVNYDNELDKVRIEDNARALGDIEKSLPFRRYARIWLDGDYQEAVLSNNIKRHNYGSVIEKVASRYNETVTRPNIEDPDWIDPSSKFPEQGMQTHLDYTLYGHFFYLKNLLSRASKVRFYLDQDSGIRAACLSAFCNEIKNRKCDAFYVRLNKNLTVNDKRLLVRESKQRLAEAMIEYPELTEKQIKILKICENLEHMIELGKWKDKWIVHPFSEMDEPEKAACCLTYFGDYSQEHWAALYNKASLHAVDKYFMLIRRRISILERPLSSSSNKGRVWHGYNPYNPNMIIKLLDIFRVFYNFYLKGKKDRKTPAMRIGIAKGPVDLEKIIY